MTDKDPDRRNAARSLSEEAKVFRNEAQELAAKAYSLHFQGEESLELSEHLTKRADEIEKTLKSHEEHNLNIVEGDFKPSEKMRERISIALRNRSNKENNK